MHFLAPSAYGLVAAFLLTCCRAVCPHEGSFGELHSVPQYEGSSSGMYYRSYSVLQDCNGVVSFPTN